MKIWLKASSSRGQASTAQYTVICPSEKYPDRVIVRAAVSGDVYEVEAAEILFVEITDTIRVQVVEKK